MKGMKALLLATMMAGTAFATSAQAADITYTGSDKQAGVDISYSITTNGNTGVLSLGDIVTSSITFTGTTESQYGAFDSFTSNDGLYFLNTNEGGTGPLSATTTSLFFNFAGDGGALNFGGNSSPDGAISNITYAFAAAGVNDGDATVYEHNGRVTKELDSPDLSNYRLADGTFTIVDPTNQAFATAAVAAVPEPATWALMLVGFGAVGYGMRRRHKVDAKVSFSA